MNWQDVIKIAFGGLLTLAGGALVPWISSRLSIRQSRWTQKRDIYARLLETLGEDDHTLTMLSNLETWPPASQLSAELIAYQKSEISKLQQKHNDLMREIYRVSSLARLFVSADAVAELNTISIPSYEDNLDVPIDDRRSDLERTRSRIIAIAMKDLGISIQ